MKLEGKHWKQVERPLHSDLVRWDQLKKQAPRGSWALLNVNVCSGRVGDDPVSHSHRTEKKCTFPFSHTYQLSRLSYLKYLEHFHISIFLNNSHFLYQEYHAGLFKKQGEPQKYPPMRGVLCNLRKSVQAIDKFLVFLSTESMFKGFQSVWFHQRCFFSWVLSVR